MKFDKIKIYKQYIRTNHYKLQMRLNDAFIYVILLEIIFILWFIDKSEMLKEKMANILPATNELIVNVVLETLPEDAVIVILPVALIL